MEWIALFVIIGIGFILLILEFLVFPGVNIPGVIGFVLIFLGVAWAFYEHGRYIGLITLLATSVLGGLLTWYALRSNTWKRLSLNTSIDSKVDGADESLSVGDIGITLGRLAPMGNAIFGEISVEVTSNDGYIGENSNVEIIKISGNKIIVKLKK